MSRTTKTILPLLLMPLLTLASFCSLAASFDCDKATSEDEKAICSHRQLNDKDVEMNTKYLFLSGVYAMGNRGNLGDEQRKWLADRKKCAGDITCLNKHYDARLSQLDTRYKHLPRPL